MALANKADLPNSQIDNGNFALYNTLLALGSSRTAPQEAQFQALRTTLLLYLWTAQDYNALVTEFTNLNNNILSEVQQELLLLRSTIERSTAGQQFSNLTGYGGASIFDSLTDDESLDFPNTTATINATAQTCTWDNSGTQILAMADVVRANNFNSITLRMYNDKLKKATVQTVTDTTNITASTNEYTLTTSDKLIHNNSEIGISNVSGGQATVDLTTNPLTIGAGSLPAKNQGSVTDFNGGVIQGVVESGTLKLYKVTDETTSTEVASSTHSDVDNFSLTSLFSPNGTEFLVVSYNRSTGLYVWAINSSYDVVSPAEVALGFTSTVLESCMASNLDKTEAFVVGLAPYSGNSSDNIREVAITITDLGDINYVYSGTNVTAVNNSNFDYTGISCTYGLNDVKIIAAVYIDRITFGGTTTNVYMFVKNPNWVRSGALASTADAVRNSTALIAINNETDRGRVFLAFKESNTLNAMRVRRSDHPYTSRIVVGTEVNVLDNSYSLTENQDGDIYVFYRNASNSIRYRRILSGTTSMTTETSTGKVGTIVDTIPRNTVFDEPIFAYVTGGNVVMSGEFEIGTGFNIELSSPITVSPNDELTISTQFEPKQGVTDIPFKSEGFRYIEYQLTGLDVNTTDITIGNTANEVVSNLVSWNAI